MDSLSQKCGRAPASEALSIPTLLFGKSQTFALHHTQTHTLASIGEVHFERLEGVETEADHRILEQPVALTQGQENDNLNSIHKCV